MSAVKFSTIRSRFAAAVEALPGFSESRNPFDPTIRAPQSVAHLRFWVGVANANAMPNRQRSPGQVVNTDLVVKFAYRLRPKDQVTDYDLSMDKAETVIQTLTTRAAPLYTNTEITFVRFFHDLTSSGEYVIISLEFQAIHTITL